MAKNPIQMRLEKAVALHQAGHLSEAERLYDQVLALDRANVDALNLKGVAANTQGRHAEALALFDRAIERLPALPDFRFNRGLALAHLERNEEALQSYLHALTLQPGFHDARLNTGLLLHKMERFDEAIEVFRALTLAAPTDPRGFYNLGACLEKRLPAISENERPDVAEEARAAFTRALELDPKNPEIHFGFANLHTFLGEYKHAIERLQVALALKPAWASAWNNLASQYEALGRRKDALDAFNRAIELDPSDAGAVVNRGMTFLAMGNLADGWAGYSRRFEDPRFPFVRRHWPWPTWNGESLDGKAILVWNDQGIGDEILHAKMLGEIAGRARSCIVECAPRLAPLYRRSFPSIRIVPNTAETNRALLGEAFDYQTSVLDLARWLRPRMSAFPNHGPILTADRAHAAALREKYQARAQGRPLVGLSWLSARPGLSHQKSLPLATFLPLISSKKLTFVNLQYGDVSAAQDFCRRHDVEIIFDPEIDSLKDLDGFAAQVAALDSVVTISNTTAHFAGALGIPTNLFLPPGTKQLWYWFDEGRFSPWYCSVRIFRGPPADGLAATRSVLERL